MVSWYKSLIEDNVNYRLFSRKNKSGFLRDDSNQLNVLEMHQNLNIDNLYILWLNPPKGMDPITSWIFHFNKKGKVYKIDYKCKR